MLPVLSAQRRRIAFFSITMSLGLLMIGLLPGLVWYTKAISFIFAPFVMAGVAAAVLAWAPSKRGWLECIGTGVLLGGGLGALTRFDGLVGLPLAIAISAALVMVLHEAWASKLPLQLSFVSSAAGHVRGDGAELWAAVVPGAGDSLVSERLIDIEADPNDPGHNTFYCALMACGELAEEVTLTLLEQDSSGTARIHIEGEDAMGVMSSGILTIKVTEMDPDTTHIELHETREGMMAGEVIERWFDDVLAGELRHLQAHFLKVNPPEPADRSAEAAAGLPEAKAAANLAPAEARAMLPKPKAPRQMKDLAKLPEDHLTLQAVRQAVSD
ncbi:hypothetical protein FHY55_13555 [Oceanicola sp. D3]|uniref:hypothetical protein n=1 Tax=Oceanicola sp. D3 TaxID=2587163 RepID=UPI00112120F1|nr:hypothetical protein [Oceanicola sp. D3]QDC10210.1 hypothetical protein FHY55_13555 [Oceanicola sp. D3]